MPATKRRIASREEFGMSGLAGRYRPAKPNEIFLVFDGWRIMERGMQALTFAPSTVRRTADSLNQRL